MLRVEEHALLPANLQVHQQHTWGVFFFPQVGWVGFPSAWVPSSAAGAEVNCAPRGREGRRSGICSCRTLSSPRRPPTLWTGPCAAQPLEPWPSRWFPARPAERGGGGSRRRGGAERRGWRQAASFVYLTAKYQGNHRLAALPPTPTAKTNSWAKRMPELS